MLSSSKTYAQVNGVDCRVISDVMFLVHPATDAIHCVDPIGGAIWKLLLKPMSVADIEMLLSNAFPEVSKVQIAGDIKRLLRDFEAWNLVQNVS
jgi:Coenzyme PQQ synthesis protein D (PqqD)